VVVIYTDDQDLDQVAALGGNVLTPAMDRLAREGMAFTEAFVASPVCTPSRYGLLTGQFASRSRHPAFARECPPDQPPRIAWNTYLVPGQPTIGSVMRTAGYRTGFFGKWHLGFDGDVEFKVQVAGSIEDPEVGAAMRRSHASVCGYIGRSFGFDVVDRVYTNNVAAMVEFLGYPPELDVHNPEWITEGVVRFIERFRDEPFCLVYTPTLPHAPSRTIGADPRITPAGLIDPPASLEAARASVGKRLAGHGVHPGKSRAEDILWLDDSVGAILDTLDRLELADDTIVLLISDHGLKGKMSLFDGGARVPMLLRWPERIPAGSRCAAMVANIDVLPTLAQLCGAEPPPADQVDGLSFADALDGRPETIREDLFLEVGYGRALLTHDGWKLIAVRFPGALERRRLAGELIDIKGHPVDPATTEWRAVRSHPAYFEPDQLYNLRSDPGERVNLIDRPEHAGRLERMRARLRETMGSLHHRFPF
jgi:arylsulfatase A-like enzyme